MIDPVIGPIPDCNVLLSRSDRLILDFVFHGNSPRSDNEENRFWFLQLRALGGLKSQLVSAEAPAMLRYNVNGRNSGKILPKRSVNFMLETVSNCCKLNFASVK